MKQTPLLHDSLSANEKAALANLLQQPGWSVVEKLHTEACRRATEDVLRQNPADTGYTDKKVVALQQRARERNEFSLLVLGSITWHAGSLAQSKSEEEQAAEPLPQNPIISALKKGTINKEKT